jgi:hypothetical protein
MPDYLTLTPPGGSATIYSFAAPAETGTIFAGSYDSALGIYLNLAIDECTPFIRGGIPELRFHRLTGVLAALPDPFEAASVSWSNGSSHSTATTYFTGSVVGYTDRYDETLGWIRDYRCLGLRNLADYVSVTDANTNSDVARWNMPSNEINTIPSRQGRTVGQAVLELLSMPVNVTALSAYGIGAYSSSGSGAAATANMTVGNTLATYGTISSLSLTTGGSGYGTTPPTVVIVGPCTTQAQYTANLTGGAVSSFTQVSAGAGYTSTPTVVISTLPAATISDLEALTVISPFPLTFCGERILQSVESVIQSCHPNHWVYVLGDNSGSDTIGTIRVLDQRATTNYTVTLGNPSGSAEPDGTYGNRWLMPRLHRDSSDTYSQLEVRGGPLVTGVYLNVLPQLDTTMNANITAFGVGPVSTGGLFPDFVFGSYTTNATAVAAWSPSSYVQQSLQGGQDHGTCSCTSTTSVVITSSNTAQTLSSDQLDQSSTGLHAILTVIQSPVTGLQQMFSTSVIANTAMTAGGTSTLTVSPSLPVTTYTSYFLTFSSQAGNVVARRFVVVDSSGYGPSSKLGPALQQYFPYPFAYKNSNGQAAAITSAPVGSVLYSSGSSTSSTTWLNSGSPPWNESDFSISVDPESGTITFPQPVNLVYGGGTVATWPSNVQVFVPVATGVLSLTSPVSGYAGTLYTVDGVQRTKTITVRDWTQESGTNLNIQTYANELFDSIKDVVVEGSIAYLGLATTYLVPGASISITGYGYTTGWETLQSSPWPAGLPVSQVQVAFQAGIGGTSYVTNLSLSNRKQRYTAEVFLRPAGRTQLLGGPAFGAGYGAAWSRGMAGFLGAQREAVMAMFNPDRDLELGTDQGVEMAPQKPRPVTMHEVDMQNQRQRRDERLEQQRLNAQRAREGRHQEGPPAPEERPFDEMNPPQPDAADIAQARRRRRAQSHPTEDVPE